MWWPNNIMWWPNNFDWWPNNFTQCQKMILIKLFGGKMLTLNTGTSNSENGNIETGTSKTVTSNLTSNFSTGTSKKSLVTWFCSRAQSRYC